MNTHASGTAGERLAEQHLLDCGYRILERNYRCRAGEIDLIASDGDYLVFVEVKYRRSAAMGRAAEAVDEKKQKRIERAAAWYLKEKHLRFDQPCRFDVVAIDDGKLQLIQDAFWS